MRAVHVPVTVEQDEDGVWCAHAWLGSSGGANAYGDTREEALASLRDAVQMVLDEMACRRNSPRRSTSRWHSLPLPTVTAK